MGFGNVMQNLHKLAKLSSSFSPEVPICLRSCVILALVFWSQIQTPWTFVKNEKPPLCLLFQLQFSVFWYHNQKFVLVFDIILHEFTLGSSKNILCLLHMCSAGLSLRAVTCHGRAHWMLRVLQVTIVHHTLSLLANCYRYTYTGYGWLRT